MILKALRSMFNPPMAEHKRDLDLTEIEVAHDPDGRIDLEASLASVEAFLRSEQDSVGIPESVIQRQLALTRANLIRLTAY